MENIVRALIMAFSMLMFVVGFSYSMYLINNLLSTSSVLLDSVATTNYYDNIEVTKENAQSERDVGVETIVPVLYRYYKENYAVKIVDGGVVVQLFDVNIEGKMSNADGYTKTTATTPSEIALLNLKTSIYNTTNNKAYMFLAPWNGNTEYSNMRVSYFLNGTKGYINNTLVDYSPSGPAFKDKAGGFLENYKNNTFTESYVEYAYAGETISTANGVETITGSTQESNKIIITYTKK